MKAVFLGCIIAMVHPAHQGHPVTVKINDVTVLKSYMTTAYPGIEYFRGALLNGYPVEGIQLKPTDRLTVYGGDVTVDCLPQP